MEIYKRIINRNNTMDDCVYMLVRLDDELFWKFPSYRGIDEGFSTIYIGAERFDEDYYRVLPSLIPFEESDLCE